MVDSFYEDLPRKPSILQRVDAFIGGLFLGLAISAVVIFYAF